ncbi:ABC-2 type transport system permease protein [Gracilibacillus orientalis]|uniref:Transport permease protein n=1 Tax=Gracilibacillus orientalis TaxID=334253 RepID=A0A1I4J6V1_9BACI|nr:ABC transporter permease [Gracilibacillus orientalis]SFL62322.1 ABC-2 type transport system permease protein [Gracilibacillus orientalis]
MIMTEQLKVEFKVYLRQPLYLVFTILMPAIFFLFFGMMYAGEQYNGIDFFSQYIPGFLVLILFASSVFNIGNQVVTDKEKGVYKRLSVAPISFNRIMFAVISKGFIVALIGYIEILIIAKFVFDVTFSSIFVFSISYVACIIYALIIGFGLGMGIKTLNNYTVIMMTSFFPMFMLSDAGLPLSLFPEFVQNLAYLNPLYHMNIALRVAWNTELYTTYQSEFFISLAFLSVFMVIFLMWVIAKWRKK